MIEEADVQRAVERIVMAARPNRVIVFGSYGRGDADDASDLDIMVVQPDVTDRYAEMVRLRQVVGPIGAGVDVLVYSQREFDRRSSVPGTVLYWARKEGRSLYEAAP